VGERVSTRPFEQSGAEGFSVTVSVVIPTHNYGHFVGQAIASVQAQTYSDWECVVVDDGSTDDTPAIVAAIVAADSRIKYVRIERGGSSAGRNAGLAASAGEYVQFLDADDLIGPGKLARDVGLLEAHPEVDLVYGTARYFAEATPGAPRSEWTWPLATPSGSGDTLLQSLVTTNMMVTDAPLIRRSMLNRVGGFDLRFRRLQDWDCWIRCALAGAVFLYDPTDDASFAPFVRVHGASVSQDRAAVLRGSIMVRRQLQPALPESIQPLNMRRMHEQQARLGLLEALVGHAGTATVLLLRAGMAERRAKWLAGACFAPLLWLPPARYVAQVWWKWRRRGSPNPLALQRG
jgi:hypothetical protein